jgi:formyltetrahydrofolate deformylase
MSNTEKVLAIISVQGRDQKGVVAQFATFVAERGINIEDMEQRVVHGVFVMDMLVDLCDMSVTLDELITGILEVGRKIGMDAKITLQRSAKTKRVVVLATKEPHCLEAIIAATKKNDLNGQIVAVLANHPVLEPIAKAAGIPFAANSAEKNKTAHMQWLLENLQAHKPDLVVLARYMQIVSEDIVRAFPSKIINIHPSLLPYFPGASPYRQAYENGVRVTGCTAHFVTEQLDQGPIILQDVFHINVGKDSAEDVRQRGLALEAEILTKAVRHYLDEELVVVDGKVVFKPGVSSFAKGKGG